MKTNDLMGAALDWAVLYIRTHEATGGKPVLTRDLMRQALKNGMASPSTDWAQGGPIIEREYIELTTTSRNNAEIWEAVFPGRGEDAVVQYGPTPLIAAMRCYVASKLGDTVEVPPELT